MGTSVSRQPVIDSYMMLRCQCIHRGWYGCCIDQTYLMVYITPTPYWVNKQNCYLSHWDWKTHLCVKQLTIIDSYHGLSPGRCQVMNWTNTDLLSIAPLRMNFSDVQIFLFKNETEFSLSFHSFKKTRLKISSPKWRPPCLGLDVLTPL